MKGRDSTILSLIAVRSGSSDFRDAEVQKLWRTVGRDEDVRGFEIAVNDQAPMCIRNSRTDLQEEFEPLPHRQLSFI